MKVLSVIIFLLFFPAPSSADDLIFPKNIQGIWGVKGCMDNIENLKITISATQIESWESIGTLQSLTQNKYGSFDVKLNMSSEGFNWISKKSLIIKNTKLVQTSNDSSKPIIRVRCK